MSMLVPGNLIVCLSAAATLGFTLYKVRAPFKSHSFNTFAYIILLLITYAIAGKKDIFIDVVRVFYLFVDKSNI